jgi:crotonobetainyl-CoA:carnitine CoA-transferase CaiB-like acyl-CoA transferase
MKLRRYRTDAFTLENSKAPKKRVGASRVRQFERHRWPALKARLQSVFAPQPRGHWRALLEGADACFAPPLSVSEAASHPHNPAQVIREIGSAAQIDAAPAPRLLPLPRRRARRRTCGRAGSRCAWLAQLRGCGAMPSGT